MAQLIRKIPQNIMDIDINIKIDMDMDMWLN